MAYDDDLINDLSKYLDTHDKAFMFIGYVPEFESMYVQLHETGYAVVLKPTYDMTRPRPEAVEQPEKGTEKALELLESPKDGDFVTGLRSFVAWVQSFLGKKD